jgi:Ca-activated chloride channel homolog
VNPSLFSEFSFAHPWVLVLLGVIPVLAFLKGRRGRAAAVIFSSTEPLRTLGHPRRSRPRRLLFALSLLALALLIVALARPRKGRTLSHIEASGIDILMALDVSRSMLAEDFTIGSERANRLEAVKQVTQKFIEGRPHDRIGIVAFAGRPYLVSPLTLDHDWLLKELDERVRIGLVEDGTAIGSAIASAANRIEKSEAKSEVLIVLTDGDNNAGKVSPETAAEAVGKLGMKLYAIGAGTRGTAPYPRFDQAGRIVRYDRVKVEFNEESLKRIAQLANGRAYRATDTRSLEDIYKEIDKLEKTKVEMTQYRRYRDLFPWFLGAGGGLFALQLILAQSVWRKLP